MDRVTLRLIADQLRFVEVAGMLVFVDIARAKAVFGMQSHTSCKLPYVNLRI